MLAPDIISKITMFCSKENISEDAIFAECVEDLLLVAVAIQEA